MSFIDSNLLPDEQILFRTKKHVIIFFFPLLWTIFSLFAVIYMTDNYILAKISWLPHIVTLVFWSAAGIEYVTSEFVVTNKRILMREGFFNRHASDMRLASISQLLVDQSLIGQLLGFGSIIINAFGGNDAFTMINHPLLFQRYVNEQLDRVTR